MNNQFTRTKILLGESQINLLSNKNIVIAGVGGVGGYVVEMLARAGIGKLTIIDHDTVDITNINRQLISDLTNVGQAKVELFEQRIKLINPDCELNPLQQFIEQNNLAKLVGNPDIVIDCIDTIGSKVDLLEYCIKNNIPVYSSMGAGNRIDVTKVKLADISKTQVCSLARNLRLRLRERKIFKGINTVYSEETIYSKPLDQGVGQRPVNGTISYMPALFGNLLAGWVLKDLIQNAK